MVPKQSPAGRRKSEMLVERNGFIAKPYTADQLYTAIDNLLR